YGANHNFCKNGRNFKMTHEKRLPFEVSLDPFYSVSNMDALNESIAQMQQGKTVTKTMEELEALADEEWLLRNIFKIILKFRRCIFEIF
ncbi:MAG: hypothetical protein K2O42_06485, partial [Oscillospiraceae bacterium]|nr:hypothetical protein [Oscillospiraceae bacterium]